MLLFFLSLLIVLLFASLSLPVGAADTEGPTFVADGTPDSGTTGDPFTFRVTSRCGTGSTPAPR
jgi:hypothetical protein